MIPGEILGPDDPIDINVGRPVLTLRVENAGDRPIQVGSHFHFAEANPALAFDREASHGHRLDVPAGTAIRFEPGIAMEVDLVPLVGDRIVVGLRGENAGPLDPTSRGQASNGATTGRGLTPTGADPLDGSRSGSEPDPGTDGRPEEGA